MSNNVKVPGWENMLVTGILMTIVGLLMIIFKAGSLDIILIIFGVLLLIFGAINAFAGMRYSSTPEIVSGAIMIVLGIAMIALTALVRDVLMVVLAIGLIIVGLSNTLSGFKAGSEMRDRIIPIIVGVAFMVVGVIALLNLEDTADVIMIVIEVITLIGGLLDLDDAYRLKTL